MYKATSIKTGESVIGNLINIGNRYFISKLEPQTYEDYKIEVYEDSISKELIPGIFENDVIICDNVYKSIACSDLGEPTTLTGIPLNKFKEVKLFNKDDYKK